MAWIDIIRPERAQGLLSRIYKDAIGRAGKVFQVLQIQSLRPRVLRASLGLYLEQMIRAEGGTTRAQREMIATVVSWANHCKY